jgi:hypothetical protein
MPRDLKHLEAVLAAADNLLAARSDQMLTSEEWLALDRAVAAAFDRGPEAGDALDALIRGGAIDKGREAALTPEGGACWEELSYAEAQLVRERMAAGRGGAAE